MDENCYLSGTINITAGVARSSQSRFVTARVIEATVNKPQIVASPWTEEALFQKPDVMSRVSIINPSQTARTNNLESYVSGVLAVSYVAAWDTFYAQMDNFTNPVDLKVNRRVDMLVAQVNRARVYAWLAIAMVLVLAGIVLLRCEIAYSRRSVTDGPVTALMTDTSGVNLTDLRTLSGCSQIRCAKDKTWQMKIESNKGEAEKWKIAVAEETEEEMRLVRGWYPLCSRVL